MPTVNHTGVSRKIESDGERRRLKGSCSARRATRRAASSSAPRPPAPAKKNCAATFASSCNLWAEIKTRSESAKSPALIYHDLNLVERMLRDQVTDNFSAIWVDTEDEYERVVRFLQRFQPSLIRRIKLYTKDTPLFEQFGIHRGDQKALRVQGVAEVAADILSSTRPKRWSPSTSTPASTSARRRGSKTRSSRPTWMRSRRSFARSGCATWAASSSSTSSTWTSARIATG